MVNDLRQADHACLVEMQMPTTHSSYHRDGFTLVEGLFYSNSSPIPQRALEHFIKVSALCVSCLLPHST